MDPYLDYKGKIVDTDAYELCKLLDPLAKFADVFHFHNGNSLLYKNSDVPVLASMGKKLVMHHWGNDVRREALNQHLNAYKIPPSYLSDAAILERLTFFGRYVSHVIIQDYELYHHVKDYYEHVHILPLACEMDRFPYAYPPIDRAVPTIVHAPTNRAFKGSEYIEKAIADLRATRSFVYNTVENLSHQEALKRYFEADIVVDQILCGTYGMLSVEAMAMGKVVVAYVRDDVKANFPPDLPIVIATPDTIRDVLDGLLRDALLRHQIGVRSRAYVDRYHNVDRVVPRLLDIYAQIGAKGG